MVPCCQQAAGTTVPALTVADGSLWRCRAVTVVTALLFTDTSTAAEGDHTGVVGAVVV